MSDFIKKSRKHLNETGWNYWQHLTHSVKQSNRLIAIAVKSYLHGIFPWMFINNGPLGVAKIYREVRKLHHVQKLFKDSD